MTWKIYFLGAGKMALWLRALVLAVEEDFAQHQNHNSQLSVTQVASKWSDVSFWLPLAPGTHMMHRYICRENTHKTQVFKVQKHFTQRHIYFKTALGV